jgi:membrane protein
VAEVLEPVADSEIQPAGVVDVTESNRKSKWYRWRRDGKALIAYLLDSEVHTFAFSVAANAILSFIPFVVLLYTLAMSVFHSQAMVNAVNEMVNYFLPSATKEPNWIIHYLLKDAVMPLINHKGVQIFSLVMILISCTGIFLPLEVALNQAWGVTKNRNYLFNQLVAFGLAILMVFLGMASVVLNAAANQLLTLAFFGNVENIAYRGLSSIILAAITGVAVVIFLFAIYWLLPNRRVLPRPIVRTAIITGIVWLVARYIFVAVLPHLDLEALYGPFFISVGLIFWAYVSGLILFAGAQFSVARIGKDREQGPGI